MTGKAQSLPINAGHGVAPESLLPCSGKRKSMAKTKTQSLRSRSTIIFVMCSLKNLLPGKLTSFFAKERLPKHGLMKQKKLSVVAHTKTADFWGNMLYFKQPYLHNTLRWMALCSRSKILKRWEAVVVRTFLIRMAGKLTIGSRQQKLRVPIIMLYYAQCEAWVAVVET